MFTLSNYTTFYCLSFHISAIYLPAGKSSTLIENLGTLCLKSWRQHLSYVSVHEDVPLNTSFSFTVPWPQTK